jgi:predicted ATP-dependent serine protease
MNKIPSKDLKGTAYVSACSVESQEVERVSTRDNELDWLYGSTKVNNQIIWGIPKSKISILAAPCGCGKSRLAIEISKYISKTGKKVLYFQNEESISSFRAKINHEDNANIKNNL